MKKISAFVFLIFCASILFTGFWGNLYLLTIKPANFIPNESSLFTFNITKMNEGSGDWWLYGEDSYYFYARSEDVANKVIKIEKTKALKIKNFNQFNYKSWQ